MDFEELSSEIVDQINVVRQDPISIIDLISDADSVEFLSN
jgi:hypothetical protein